MDPDSPALRLPVHDVLPRLRAALADVGSAVLVAPPGAGKTTLVPPALLGEGWLGNRKLVMLEPRRLAARAAADRIAHLLGEEGVGGVVGHRVRMDTRVGPDTRIEVVTEGVLRRMLHTDPALSGVGALLFDEFHERSLHADLGLALALQTRHLFRNDLRLLVMSATLEAAPVAEILGGAPVLRSEGQIHPIETRWLGRPVRGPIEPAAARAVLRMLEETGGDVLVFLPGAGEIRRTEERLAGGPLPPGVHVHALHGSLSRQQQDRAIRPAPPGGRKVVLASAVAESSLTIEGVRVVIDAGLARVPRFDPGSGMTRLETIRVPRDSADQRRGRAGRVAPGVCLRLWTKAEDRGLVATATPEILEADLAPLALDLAAWGAEPEELSWLDPPPAGAYAQARELLAALGLLDDDGGLTGHGRSVASLGAHPRLGHLLVRGRELGLGSLACGLAALLEERDVLRAEGRAPDADLALRVDLLLRGRAAPLPGGHRVDRGGLRRVERQAERWARLLGVGEPEANAAELGRIGVLAALAYPDRIGRRREGARGRFLLTNGRGARLEDVQALDTAEWLVAVDVEGRGRDARIFRAAAVEAAAIEAHFAEAIGTADEVTWDEASGRLRATRVRRLGAVEVGAAPLAAPHPGEMGRTLLEAVRRHGLELLGWDAATRGLRQRLRFLHALEPRRWPDASEEALLDSAEEWLLPYLQGLRSFDELSGEHLGDALLARRASPGDGGGGGLDERADAPFGASGLDVRSAIERLAPTHIRVPSGSRIAVDYSDPQAPALAVRLQEVFGLTETPRVGGGRVPVTMKLLSPAHRPVQVTRDLASFWNDAYFDVRKDLRGRYPKHHWPEDPLSAVPTRRTRPR